MLLLKKINGRIQILKTQKKEKSVAKKFYREWLSEKSNDEISVFLSGLIGDAVYAMAYMADFAEKNNKKKIVLYYDAKRKELIDTYTLPANCVLLEIKDKNTAYKMGCFMRTKKYARLGLKNNIISTVPIYSFPNKPTLKMFSKKMYKIGTGRIVTPLIPNVSITSIENFYEKKDKIIVLNHASGGAAGIIKKNIPLFELIADYLSKKGFEVYTNVIQGQEPIKGTKSLNCSIFELYNICKNIPLFISVRSGITDLMVSTGVNMFILYTSFTLYSDNAKWKKEFTLSEWGQKGKLYEYVPIPMHFLSSYWIKNAFVSFKKWFKKTILAS